MNELEPGIKLPSASQVARGIGAMIGLIMMVLGIVYSARIFGWVAQGVREPEKVAALVKRWEQSLGKGESFIVEPVGEIPVYNMLSLLILGGAMVVLIRIAFLFVTEGAKAIQNTLGEKDAIKSILTYTFGPGQVKQSSDDKRNSSKTGS